MLAADIAGATWVLVGIGIATLIGGAVKLGMDIGEVKREIKPNGGNTKSLGDTVLNVKELLAEHLEQDSKRQAEIGKLLIDGQQQLLEAVRGGNTKADTDQRTLLDAVHDTHK